MLFTPPFEKSAQEPGYVKAYPRGIRENGGQYTHAAVWTAIAFAMQGNAARAMEVFNMLNPIRRSTTRADVQRYKVEPYVVAADVYSEAPHAGRGGWTWYTGSAGWLYRAGLEWILGFRVHENRLTLVALRAAGMAWLHHSLPTIATRLTKSSSTGNPIRAPCRSWSSTAKCRMPDANDRPGRRRRAHTVRVTEWRAATAQEDFAATRSS